MQKKSRAVFLDRDGVINKIYSDEGIPKPPSSVEELIILPGVPEAINLFNMHGFVTVVVTNQPDIARNKTSIDTVNAINRQINRLVGIEHFYICPHDDIQQCICRKPKPGLINAAAKDLNLNLQESFLVGDRWKDIAAGQAVGIKSFFIENSYPEQRPEMPFVGVTSLLDAAQIVTGA